MGKLFKTVHKIAICVSAFPTAASRIWNSRPLHITSAPSLQTLPPPKWPILCRVGR